MMLLTHSIISRDAFAVLHKIAPSVPLQRPTARGIRSLQACHHGQVLDLVIKIRLQKRIVVFD
jgi:hypothetical protein